MIVPHFLRPNKSEASPSNMVFVDCESRVMPTGRKDRSAVQSLRFWVARHVRMKGPNVERSRWEKHTSAREFWNWIYRISNPSRPVWIWSHGAGTDMTWLGLWDELDAGRLEWRNGAVDNVPFIAHVRHGRCNIHIADTLNWFRCPLRELGDCLGRPKYEMPCDDATESEWERYCTRDVEILSEAVLALVSFCRSNRLGMFRATAPGQAFASWRHLHKGPWPEIHGVPEYSTLERAAYYGGVNEVFFRGRVEPDEGSWRSQQERQRRDGPIKYGAGVNVWDFRSYYPAVMADNHYPYRLVAVHDELAPYTLSNILKAGEAIATVLLNTESDRYPLRNEVGLYHAVGKFWTILAGPELRKALARNQVERVGHTLAYETADLFGEWVDVLWHLRTSYHAVGNRPWELMIKLLLNSLFGKFGQRADGWRDVRGKPCRQRWGMWIEWSQERGRFIACRGVAGKRQEKFRGEEGNNSFVAIPACVTSHGRVGLWKIADRVPAPYLYYADTDSVHVAHAGNHFMEDFAAKGQEDLGLLTLRQSAESAEYRSRKIYRIGDDYKIAGLPRQASRIDDWHFVYTEWERMESILDGGPSSQIHTREAGWRSSLDYTWGTVATDGHVRPVRFYCLQPIVPRPQSGEEE